METNHGYYRVGIFINGRCIHKRVHRLVAEAFIQNPDNLPVVHHKDGNKKNNNVSNLEWTTFRENSLYACDDGVMLYGENHPRASITDEQAHMICELLEENIKTKREIAEICNTTRNVVDSMLRGKWKHVTKEYNIQSYNVRSVGERIDVDTVINIAELIMKNKYSNIEIANKVGCKPYTVTDIKQKKIYKKLLKDYDFPIKKCKK